MGRAGAYIVLSEKSLARHSALSLRDKVLIRMKPSLADPSPYDCLPLPPEDVGEEWYWGNSAYIVTFINPAMRLHSPA